VKNESVEGRSGDGTFRCGVVALLGRPNCGKSTLLNALLGEKLAITATRAQTTRSRILGVLTLPQAQVLFYDTPGVHRGEARFNLAMTAAALSAAEDADLRVVLFESTVEWDRPEERLSELPSPLLLVRTKRDLGPPTPVPRAQRFTDSLEISAQEGRGLEALLERIVSYLPEGPALYPEDSLTDRSQRFLAAEQIREVAFEMFREEIPYALAVEVEEWKETDHEVRARANVLVERESQKGIVVGAGGAALRDLGTEARRRLSTRLGKTVHLQLWVKTDRNWTKKPRRIRELGYL
jgi:GTP-binding protein Era